jgi:uroporphyrin-III C-methyltransferase/precorrin-2 dehydrogenase/sirohydrochlorin ferrochelatase
MPTQRTINSTLKDVARRAADEGIRPPAVVVIGGVVAVAAEIARLAESALGLSVGAPASEGQ